MQQDKNENDRVAEKQRWTERWRGEEETNSQLRGREKHYETANPTPLASSF